MTEVREKITSDIELDQERIVSEKSGKKKKKKKTQKEKSKSSIEHSKKLIKEKD